MFGLTTLVARLFPMGRLGFRQSVERMQRRSVAIGNVYVVASKI
jgi:hypothetical protein